MATAGSAENAKWAIIMTRGAGFSRQVFHEFHHSKNFEVSMKQKSYNP